VNVLLKFFCFFVFVFYKKMLYSFKAQIYFVNFHPQFLTFFLKELQSPQISRTENAEILSFCYGISLAIS